MKIGAWAAGLVSVLVALPVWAASSFVVPLERHSEDGFTLTLTTPSIVFSDGNTWRRPNGGVFLYPTVDLRSVAKYRLAANFTVSNADDVMEVTLGYSIDGGNTWDCLGPAGCTVLTQDGRSGATARSPTQKVSIPTSQRSADVLLSYFWRPSDLDVDGVVSTPRMYSAIAQFYYP